MKILDNRFSLLGLVAGAMMIGFSGVWVKISHDTPTVSAFYRVFFGGIILLVLALVRDEVKWKGRQNALLILVCSFFFALDLVFYHYSIHLVGPGLGTILPNFQVFILSAVFLAAEVFRTGASFQIPDLQGLAALVALGGISQVAGGLLITNALPNIHASLSGLILLLQPALASQAVYTGLLGLPPPFGIRGSHYQRASYRL